MSWNPNYNPLAGMQAAQQAALQASQQASQQIQAAKDKAAADLAAADKAAADKAAADKAAADKAAAAAEVSISAAASAAAVDKAAADKTATDAILTSNIQIFMCNRNTQIYDSMAGGCVSCRDPTVKPIVNSTPSSTTPISMLVFDPASKLNSGRQGKPTNMIDPNPTLSYTCTNKPFKTYDANNKLISQTCDSGETFNTTTGLCEITFLPKTNNNGKIY